MESDKLEVLRELQHVGVNPFISDRIQDPFSPEAFVDVEDVNQKAFNDIKFRIESVRTRSSSYGILVLGEAGTGKTHLLARLRKQVAGKQIFLFVPRPTNPTAVLGHVWSKVFESLCQTLDGKEDGVSQIDALLRQAFSRLLKENIAADKNLAPKTVADFERVIERLRRGDATVDDVTTGVRNRIREQFHRPKALATNEADQFLAAWINHALYRDKARRTTVREFLHNYDVEQDQCESIGLKAWQEVTDQTSQEDEASRRETWALEAMRVISRLAHHAGLPLILAFDQVEGLRDKLSLTRAWGDAIREVMDQTTSVVVIACVFPSLWNEWFTRQREGGAPLEQSVVDRLAAKTLELQPLSEQQTLTLVKRRLRTVLPKTIDRPTELYPFTEDRVRELHRANAGKSVRSFLQRCADEYEQLVLQTEQVQREAQGPFDVLRNFLGRTHSQSELDSTRIGQLHELIAALSPTTLFKASLERNGRVMPENLVCAPELGSTLAIAICNARGGSLRWRLKNWLHVTEAVPRKLFLRSATAKEPGTNTNIATLFSNKANNCHLLSEAAESYLFAFHQALIAIEEGDLWAGDAKITVEDLRAYWQHEGIKLINKHAPFASGLLDEMTKPNPSSPFPVNVSDELASMEVEHVASPASSLPSPGSLEESTLELPAVTRPSVDAAPAWSVVPPLESLDLRVPQSEADGILAILREFARDYDVPLVLNQPEVITTPHLLTFLCDQRRGSEVGKIEKRATELRQMVRAPARIYPVVNRGKIAIEVQRATRAPWHFGQALRMMPAPVGGSIVVPLGIGSLGEMASINLLEPAGLLVAGASGSGKSNFLNSLIASCVLRYSATEVSIDVADIKQVDFDFFQHAAPPHIRSLRTEVDSVLRLLEDTVADIERRNKILLTNQKRKWGELAGSSSSEPYQILIVDEVADLVQNGEVGKACAAAIQRIAQKGRSAGICLILCSQYPKADIIPSATSANLSNRVAFKLQNGRQSSVILDRDGAEELTGKGDCLANLEGYPPGARFLAPHFDSGAEEAVRAHCERLRKLE